MTVVWLGGRHLVKLRCGTGSRGAIVAQGLPHLGYARAAVSGFPLISTIGIGEVSVTQESKPYPLSVGFYLGTAQGRM